MPASMISADTGCSAYVVGNSIAMVATGPMPGSTPISVPSSAPISAYSRLTGVSATPKPTARWPIRSMASFLLPPGPDRQLQLQPDDEYSDGEGSEQNTGDQRFARAELVACGARRHDQQHRRQRDADGAHDRAEQHDAAQYDDERPPAERWHRRADRARCAQREDCAEDDEQDAEDAREITGTHPRRRAERVLRGERDRCDAEHDEQHARPEVLGIADRHHPTLRRLTTQEMRYSPGPGVRCGAQDSIAIARFRPKKGQAEFACPSSCTRADIRRRSSRGD